jgi:antitoxin ParD1/3/4
MIGADMGSQLERCVARLVESGRNSSQREVLCEDIRLLQELGTGLSLLGHALAQGLTDRETGRVKPMSEVLTRLQAKYAGM